MGPAQKITEEKKNRGRRRYLKDSTSKQATDKTIWNVLNRIRSIGKLLVSTVPRGGEELSVSPYCYTRSSRVLEEKVLEWLSRVQVQDCRRRHLFALSQSEISVEDLEKYLGTLDDNRRICLPWKLTTGGLFSG